jgi:hypothetical protein
LARGDGRVDCPLCKCREVVALDEDVAAAHVCADLSWVATMRKRPRPFGSFRRVSCHEARTTSDFPTIVSNIKEAFGERVAEDGDNGVGLDHKDGGHGCAKQALRVVPPCSRVAGSSGHTSTLGVVRLHCRLSKLRRILPYKYESLTWGCERE